MEHKEWEQGGQVIYKADGGSVIATVNYIGMEDEGKANACLIVSSVNACIKLNPDNPLAVAEGISDLYEALKEITAQFRRVEYLYSKDLFIIEKAEQALAKVTKEV